MALGRRQGGPQSRSLRGPSCTGRYCLATFVRAVRKPSPRSTSVAVVGSMAVVVPPPDITDLHVGEVAPSGGAGRCSSSWPIVSLTSWSTSEASQEPGWPMTSSSLLPSWPAAPIRGSNPRASAPGQALRRMGKVPGLVSVIISRPVWHRKWHGPWSSRPRLTLPRGEERSRGHLGRARHGQPRTADGAVAARRGPRAARRRSQPPACL
jgi:hypothetical protein